MSVKIHKLTWLREVSDFSSVYPGQSQHGRRGAEETAKEGHHQAFHRDISFRTSAAVHGRCVAVRCPSAVIAEAICRGVRPLADNWRIRVIVMDVGRLGRVIGAPVTSQSCWRATGARSVSGCRRRLGDP
jgi:hypothetical protein